MGAFIFAVCFVYKVRKMKAKGDYAGKICVVVGTVTDDLRLYEVPALKVRLFVVFSVFGIINLKFVIS